MFLVDFLQSRTCRQSSLLVQFPNSMCRPRLAVVGATYEYMLDLHAWRLCFSLGLRPILHLVLHSSRSIELLGFTWIGEANTPHPKSRFARKEISCLSHGNRVFYSSYFQIMYTWIKYCTKSFLDCPTCFYLSLDVFVVWISFFRDVLIAFLGAYFWKNWILVTCLLV